jgi:putative spermidine/putrescine transport system permease protein
MGETASRHVGATPASPGGPQGHNAASPASAGERRFSLSSGVFRVYIGFVLVMLYFPFIIMAILSFQGPRGGHTFPLKGVSSVWWWKLFNPGATTEFSDVGEFLGDYLGALGRSLILAFVVAIISTILALMAAHAFRKPFRGSSAVFYLWLLGIIVPGITVSLGLFLVLNRLGITPDWKTSTLGVHVMWTLPFCLIIFLMAFNRFDLNLEDAALVFGANPLQAYWYVTLPVLQPFILSSLLFGFTLSLDEFQRSLLLTGTTLDTQTLPVMIMASVTTRITPTLYALGTLTTLLSFALIAAYIFFLVRSERRSNIPVVSETVGE